VVHGLPHGVRDVVGARGGGVHRLLGDIPLLYRESQVPRTIPGTSRTIPDAKTANR